MAVDQRYGLFKVWDGADWDVLNPNIDTAQIISGELSMDRIGALAITNAKLASGIDAAKLTTGTLPVARIADGAILDAKLGSGIDASKLTLGTLPIARIADGAILDAKLGSGIDASKITTGTLPSGVLPALAITTPYVVGSEGLQLGLDVQIGDVAIRTDLNKSFIALNGDNADMGDWQELLTPADAITSVAGETGTVTKAELLAALGLTDAEAHTLDDTKHRLISDGGVGNDVLWSGYYIDQVLGSYVSTAVFNAHDHDDDYEPKNSNIQTHIGTASLHRTINDGGSGLTDLLSASQILSYLGTKEPTIASKGTAFNKDFGTAAGDVCQGNDSRLSAANKIKVMDSDTFALHSAPVTGEIVFVYPSA